MRITGAETAILALHGIYTPALAYMGDGWRDDFGLAMDAQPGLVTSPNSGIPAFLSNILDPEVVRILTAPMNAVDIFGEVKKGDWTTLSTQFPVVESTGEVSSYGDWNTNGSTGANISFVPRQSYAYQTISQYGERELEMYGLAKLDYVSELNVSAALILSKFQNFSYFFGIAGLANYGALNDPSLIAPITPGVKTGGGYLWATPTTTAAEIYSDVLALFAKLQVQMGGLTRMDAVMTLAMSPTLEVQLAKVSAFNVTARQTIEGNFKNLRIVTAPEYSTAGGELMQLKIDAIDGVKTTYGAFTEKLRAHPVIAGLSNFMQKKSAGTWGMIMRRPIAISQMLGM
jgi:hypothetical protein